MEICQIGLKLKAEINEIINEFSQNGSLDTKRLYMFFSNQKFCPCFFETFDYEIMSKIVKHRLKLNFKLILKYDREKTRNLYKVERYKRNSLIDLSQEAEINNFSIIFIEYLLGSDYTLAISKNEVKSSLILSAIAKKEVRGVINLLELYNDAVLYSDSPNYKLNLGYTQLKYAIRRQNSDPNLSKKSLELSIFFLFEALNKNYGLFNCPYFIKYIATSYRLHVMRREYHSSSNIYYSALHYNILLNELKSFSSGLNFITGYCSDLNSIGGNIPQWLALNLTEKLIIEANQAKCKKEIYVALIDLFKFQTKYLEANKYLVKYIIKFGKDSFTDTNSKEISSHLKYKRIEIEKLTTRLHFNLINKDIYHYGNDYYLDLIESDNLFNNIDCLIFFLCHLKVVYNYDVSNVKNILVRMDNNELSGLIAKVPFILYKTQAFETALKKLSMNICTFTKEEYYLINFLIVSDPSLHIKALNSSIDNLILNNPQLLLSILINDTNLYISNRFFLNTHLISNPLYAKAIEIQLYKSIARSLNRNRYEEYAYEDFDEDSTYYPIFPLGYDKF